LANYTKDVGGILLQEPAVQHPEYDISCLFSHTITPHIPCIEECTDREKELLRLGISTPWMDPAAPEPSTSAPAFSDRPWENEGSDDLATPDNTSDPPDAIVPPYWQSHRRGLSYVSIVSSNTNRPAAITLEDNTQEDADDPGGLKSPLWARMVSVDSHVVITGNVKGIGDYVVWICKVQTLDVRSLLCASLFLSLGSFSLV
jgi:hypothetical protein